MTANTDASLILYLAGFLTVFSAFVRGAIHIKEGHNTQLRGFGPPPRLHWIKVYMLWFVLLGATYLTGSLLSWSFDIDHWRWRSVIILIFWIVGMADIIYMDLRFEIISVILIIAGLSFSLASLCSWSFNLFNWNWYSLCIGVIGIWLVFIFTFQVIHGFFKENIYGFLGKILGALTGILIIASIFFAIASLCSWSFNFTNWNWFSIGVGSLGIVVVFNRTFYSITGMPPAQYFFVKKS